MPVLNPDVDIYHGGTRYYNVYQNTIGAPGPEIESSSSSTEVLDLSTSSEGISTSSSSLSSQGITSSSSEIRTSSSSSSESSSSSSSESSSSSSSLGITSSSSSSSSSEGFTSSSSSSSSEGITSSSTSTEDMTTSSSSSEGLNLTVKLYGTDAADLGTYNSDGYYGAVDGSSHEFTFSGATFSADSVYQLEFSSLHPIPPPECDNASITVKLTAGTEKTVTAVYLTAINRWLTAIQWSGTTELVSITVNVCEEQSSSDST
jgi:hypothetical protein